MASPSECNAAPAPKPKLYRCGTCSSDFPNLVACVNHMKTHATTSSSPGKSTSASGGGLPAQTSSASLAVVQLTSVVVPASQNATQHTSQAAASTSDKPIPVALFVNQSTSAKRNGTDSSGLKDPQAQPKSDARGGVKTNGSQILTGLGKEMAGSVHQDSSGVKQDPKDTQVMIQAVKETGEVTVQPEEHSKDLNEDITKGGNKRSEELSSLTAKGKEGDGEVGDAGKTVSPSDDGQVSVSNNKENSTSSVGSCNKETTKSTSKKDKVTITLIDNKTYITQSDSQATNKANTLSNVGAATKESASKQERVTVVLIDNKQYVTKQDIGNQFSSKPNTPPNVGASDEAEANKVTCGSGKATGANSKAGGDKEMSENEVNSCGESPEESSSSSNQRAGDKEKERVTVALIGGKKYVTGPDVNDHINNIAFTNPSSSSEKNSVMGRLAEIAHVADGQNMDHNVAGKRFECQVCGAQFSHPSSLSTHKKRHSGMKPYTCQECDKTFWDPSNLRVHRRTHTNARPFICDICGHRCNQANDLKTHRRIHTGERPYVCKEEGCDRTFRDSSHFRKHMKWHKGIKPHIPCDLCDALFFNASGLARHRMTHTGEKNHECDVCKTRFARSDTLKLHLRTHTGEKPYQCGECGIRFADRSQCRRHIRKAEHLNNRIIVIHDESKKSPTQHLIKQEPADPLPTTQATNAKTQQKKPVVLRVPLTIANSTAGGQTTYETIELEIPDSEFSSSANPEGITYQYGDMLITVSQSMVNQLQETRPEVQPSLAEGSLEDASNMVDIASDTAENDAKSIGWFSCSYCGLAFASNTQLQDHKLVCGILKNPNAVVNRSKTADGTSVPPGSQSLNEHGELMLDQTEVSHLSEQDNFIDDFDDHEDPLSPETTILDTKRQRNPRIGERRFACGSCDATFFQMAELKRHLLKHTGEKPYHCKFCGKQTRDPSNLKRHIRTHTGERPYKCKVCEKRFSQAGHLTSHLRTHTGERPYSCDKCDARFVESNHLRHHLKVHAGIKPFKCDRCELAFIRLAELKRHQLIHAGTKDYKCGECSATFFRQDALKQHMLKHTKPAERSRHACHFCPQSFAKPGFLHRHMITVHKQEKPSLQVDKPDAENSVVADALCELATGCRASTAAVENDDANGTVVTTSSDLNSKTSISDQVMDITKPQTVHAGNDSVLVISHGEENMVTKSAPNLHTKVHSVQTAVVEGGSPSGVSLLNKIATGSIVLGNAEDASEDTSYIVLSEPGQSEPKVVSILKPVQCTTSPSAALSSSNISVAAMEVCTTSETTSPVSTFDHQYVSQSVLGQGSSHNASFMVGGAATLEMTMQSILSGQAELESVNVVEVRAADTGQVGSGGQVIIKQEPPDTVNTLPTIAPLRTRSGRERKIKVKISM